MVDLVGQTLYPQDRQVIDANKVSENTTIEQENFDEIEEELNILQENRAFEERVIIVHPDNPDSQLIVECNAANGWNIQAVTQNEQNETLLLNPKGGDVCINGATHKTCYYVSSVPATATSTGTAGQIAYDSSYLYICVATNTWKRTALSSW